MNDALNLRAYSQNQDCDHCVKLDRLWTYKSRVIRAVEQMLLAKRMRMNAAQHKKRFSPHPNTRFFVQH